MRFTRPEPRPAVVEMAPYHPPAGGRQGKLRLDFNENTLGASPRVVEKLQSLLSAEMLTVYPEYTTVLPALAQYFKVGDDELLLSNGTDEAIQVLVNTYVDNGDDVLILTPSYAMYRFYSEVAGATVRTVPYRENTLKFPIAELLAAIRPETKAILISNPNNPTGTAVSKEALQQILDAAPEAAVLVDEAYYEFCGITMLTLLNEYPNLFVSRTFSKVYGLAGLRIGCLFSSADNIEVMQKAQSPYSVNVLAAIAAKAAVEDQAYITSYVTEILAARELLCVGLEKLDVPYYESHANFVLMQVGPRAIAVRDKLRAKGVLVRDRSYEIAGCVRVTVGSRDQVRRFLSEFEAIWRAA